MYSLLYFVEHKLCSCRLLLMTFAEKTNLLNRRNVFEYLCIMLNMTMFTHDFLVTFKLVRRKFIAIILYIKKIFCEAGYIPINRFVFCFVHP